MNLMRKNLILGAVTAIFVGSTLLVGPATASVPPSAKEKLAIAAYAKSMGQIRATYLSTVRASRQAVVKVGKPAEVIRRAEVKSALIAFRSVATTAKAPSLAAEKSYRATVAKLKASPGDISLKADVKASLLKLTKATAALKVDPKVATARAIFKKIRTEAMAKFRATLAPTIAVRTQTKVRATAQFKAAKTKALINLKAAIKAAKTTPKKTTPKKTITKKSTPTPTP